MKTTKQVDAQLMAHGISLDGLRDMVKRSAPWSHEWANRRYRDWLLIVNMETMEVKRMGMVGRAKPVPTYLPPGVGSEYMEDACPECEGVGCVHCAHTGKVKVKVYLDKPKKQW